MASILDFFNNPEKTYIPNRFTTGMGELIRNARKEAGLSQGELAKTAYFRQASISDIENGKREVSSSELLYFSYALNKPITYFFPAPYDTEIDQTSLSTIEQELIMVIRDMKEGDLKRLIAQARALADFSDA